MAGLNDNIDSVQIDSVQATLLLYLADELSPEERYQLESRLASETSVRAQFDRLREFYDAIEGYFKASDAHSRLPTPASVAIARASRSIRQWSVKRVVAPVAPKAAAGLRWMYPAVAATLLMGVGLVIHFHKTHAQPNQIAVGPNVADEGLADFDPSRPSPAMVELSDQQGQALLEAFNHNGGPMNPETAVANSLDDADRAVANLRGSDDLDNIFLGISTDDRQEMR